MIYSNSKGFLLPLVLVSITLLSALAVHLQHVSNASNIQLQAANKAQATLTTTDAQQSLLRAAAFLSAESVIAADGYPIAPEPVQGANPPMGGGFVPPSSKSPKSAGTKVMGYCAWDNGATTNTLNYIAGINSPASVAMAVVYPGTDGIFQTNCDQAGASTAQGDDLVVAVATTQIVKQTNLPE